MAAPQPDPAQPATPHARNGGLVLSAACTALVAAGAAYASYKHGRDFAARFGADSTTAAIWPLIVDGLLLLATIELWRPNYGAQVGKWPAWTTFTFGVSLSLAANIAAAPHLSPAAITVAVCPPLALLLAVELLNRAITHHRDNTSAHSGATAPAAPIRRTTAGGPAAAQTAAQRMRAYYLHQQSLGRTPTGAELDRIAGTHNYGRRLIRQWKNAEYSHGTSAIEKHKQPQQDNSQPGG